MTAGAYLVLALVLVVVAAVSFWCGRRSVGRVSGEGEDASEEEEMEEPTAPISPVVELARSPHDRHRDLAVGRELVKRLDMIAPMIENARRRSDEETANQLQLLRDELEKLLSECSIRSFSYESGTQVSVFMRGRIQIVEGTAQSERTIIEKTLRCGYVYSESEDEETVIRKAEVVIA